MSATSTLADVNETVFGMIGSVQDRIVEANRQVADRAAGVVPSIPFAAPAVATTRELAEKAYAAQVKAVEANKRFAMSLIEAWAPVLADTSDAK